MAGELLFAIDGVALRRGGTTLLEGISFGVGAGCLTALVGRSGSGKSTLLRLLNRLTEPDRGAVTFRGVPLPDWDVLDLRKRVQLVAQAPVLLAGTVAEEVALGAGTLPRERLEELLRRVGLSSGFADRETTGLSGGEAQRLCLARALALDPEALLLDEPASALDAESAEAIELAVRAFLQQGGTVVLVTHDTPQVRRLAEHAVVLAAGAVSESGAPDQLAYLKE